MLRKGEQENLDNLLRYIQNFDYISKRRTAMILLMLKIGTELSSVRN